MRSVVFTLVLFASCSGFDFECATSSECVPSQICHAGECIPTPRRPPTPEAAPPGPQCGRPPEPGEIVINEILYAVPPGVEGDANRDGVRDAFSDEFVEIANTTNDTIALRGVRIQNGERDRFAFTGTCLEPKRAVVVFGGGNPAAIANAVRSDRQFAFANGGGVVRLVLDDDVLDRAFFGGIEDRSENRSPDLVGDVFVPHQFTQFSPGRCQDGTPFDGCD